MISLSEDCLKVLLATNDLVFEMNLDNGKFDAAPQRMKLFGAFPQDYIGARDRLLSLCHPDDREILDNTATLENLKRAAMGRNGKISGEIRIKMPDGTYRWFRLVLVPLADRNKKVWHCIGCLKDINDSMEQEEQLKYLASHDELTGLLNRRAFEGKISEYIANMDSDETCCLLLIDLDNFKKVNDRYGHLTGDCALKEVSRIFQKTCDPSTLIARIGGDEFVMFTYQNNGLEYTQMKFEQMQMHLEKWCLNNIPNIEPVTLSVGVAICPLQGKSFNELYSYADKMLRKVKSTGKGHTAMNEETLGSEDE